MCKDASTLRFCHLHLNQVHLSVRDLDLAWVAKNNLSQDGKRRELIQNRRHKTCKSSVHLRGNDVMMNKAMKRQEGLATMIKWAFSVTIMTLETQS